MAALPTPCLIGPTGSGKSDVSLALARHTQGEIVSCDAYAVYRGMPILTAAPDAPDDVPHHLVGDRSPTKPWSAAVFTEACERLVTEIRARGRTPWIVGGTALYLRGWLKGFGPPVERDEAFRVSLRTRAETEGAPSLHAELQNADPTRADELHPNDLTRVIRALEIIHATGRPASTQREEWRGPDRRDAVVFGLRREARDLEDRIRRRADAMFEAGVVAEARALLAQPLSAEARKVLGLDVLEQLLAGAIDEAEAREAIVTKTRQFAKKQRTFFASFDEVVWIDVGPGEGPEATASRVLDAWDDQGRGTSA